MKKFAILLIAALVGVASVSATQDGDSLVINGTVSENVSAAVDDATITLTIPNDGSTVSGSSVMTVVSNRKTWTVSLSSAKLGYLEATSGDKVPYNVTIAQTGTMPAGAGTVTSNLSSTQLTAAATKTVVGASDARTKKGGLAFSFTVTVPTQGVDEALWAADSYTDTITVTITAE